MVTLKTRDLWDDLTDKQIEAMQLVSDGYTSKEAARVLDITPKVFDRRIDAVRRRLGDVTRVEAARLFRNTYGEGGDSPPRGSSPLPPTPPKPAPRPDRTEGEFLMFADSHSFAEPAPWESLHFGKVPEIEPAQLGATSRLALMGGGAVVIAATLLILLGVANGLENLIVG